VVHLNERRIGNIQCRRLLRGYEIPDLGLSGSSADTHIPVTDLMVSVRSGRIALRSRARDREVIPRLSTAHNYRLRSLAIYVVVAGVGGYDLTTAPSWIRPLPAMFGWTGTQAVMARAPQSLSEAAG
jgi:hypothetical protein